MTHRRSSSEEKMATMLAELDLEFVEQALFEGHKVDFVVSDLNGDPILIETNGDWWHRTEMWKATDRKKLARWKKAGRRVIGVWESRIDASPDIVKATIVAMVEGMLDGPEFWDWEVDRP